jgi:hypothetical protein
MKTINILYTALAAMLLLSACNKDEKMLEKMEGNWQIESSVKTIHYADGTVETMETISNAGTFVLAAGSSDDIKSYTFFHIDSNNDTMNTSGDLVTDEYRTRMVMTNGYTDTSGAKKNIVWTIEKEKKNKQVWSTYGVDSTLFYPSNNLNPGAAGNWVVWTITLKRQ